MPDEKKSLEEECDDAVYQICCTRERYSVRCAKQFKQYIELSTKKCMLHVEDIPVPSFKLPDITEEQKQFLNFDESVNNTAEQTFTKSDERNISNRLKELKSIVNQIERSRNSEMHQLLETQKIP